MSLDANIQLSRQQQARFHRREMGPRELVCDYVDRVYPVEPLSLRFKLALHLMDLFAVFPASIENRNSQIENRGGGQ